MITRHIREFNETNIVRVQNAKCKTSLRVSQIEIDHTLVAIVIDNYALGLTERLAKLARRHCGGGAELAHLISRQRAK